MVLLSPIITMNGKLEPEFPKGMINRSDPRGMPVCFMTQSNQSRVAKGWTSLKGIFIMPGRRERH